MNRPALLVFAAALAFYLIGLAPGVGWGDTAQFQLRAADLALEPERVAQTAPMPVVVVKVPGEGGA